MSSSSACKEIQRNWTPHVFDFWAHTMLKKYIYIYTFSCLFYSRNSLRFCPQRQGPLAGGAGRDKSPSHPSGNACGAGGSAVRGWTEPWALTCSRAPGERHTLGWCYWGRTGRVRKAICGRSPLEANTGKSFLEESKVEVSKYFSGSKNSSQQLSWVAAFFLHLQAGKFLCLNLAKTYFLSFLPSENRFWRGVSKRVMGWLVWIRNLHLQWSSFKLLLISYLQLPGIYLLLHFQVCFTN